MSEDEVYEGAAWLLLQVWRAVDLEFKHQYRREIWRIFEENVRLSANQASTLARFLAALAGRVRADLSAVGDRGALLDALRWSDAQQRAVLRVLRAETSLVVMMLREILTAEREVHGEDANV